MVLALAAALFAIDGHADTPQFLLDLDTDLAQAGEQMVDLPKARKGGLGGEFFSIWVDPDVFGAHPARRALDLVDAVLLQIQRHPRELSLATTARQVEAARKARKLAVLMGLEGGHALEGDLRLLRTFHRLGVRYMTLTWSNTNELGDSSGDMEKPEVKHHGGLSPLGREAVQEMNRLGMLVDISHVADKTFFDALEVSRAPVIASHSGCRALTNHPRNLTDEMLRALAKNGGVVMVNFFSAFVDEEFRKAMEALRPELDKAVAEVNEKYRGDPAARTRAWFETEWRITSRIPRPPLSSLIDHIEHVARVAGVDHAGIGSDFDGISSLPQGIDSAADLPKVASELRKRGFSQAEVAKIFSGNILRVMRAAEKVAAAGQGR
ncbi:MAG TPA: dipeptidase [Myxococcales bacterium]|nr:dipeptidase [Myxococcales bacterium]